jgi:hypothetical protein
MGARIGARPVRPQLASYAALTKSPHLAIAPRWAWSRDWISCSRGMSFVCLVLVAVLCSSLVTRHFTSAG